MTYTSPKPAISPDFTMDDIHRLREWHYDCTKDIPRRERQEHYHRIALQVQREITAISKGVRP
jgi:hypothetical protein